MYPLHRTVHVVLAGLLTVGAATTGVAAPLTQEMATPMPMMPSAEQTPEQLEQLVAPIALYPDPLVSEILNAASHPDQLSEAARWVREHPELQAKSMAKKVDKQPWNDSVKSLVEVPAVLANMDQNRAWTEALGNAYLNRESDVVNAIQAMRQRAQQAGNLRSTPQQTVINQGSTIQIVPADPTIIYVPQYNPWYAYGAPVVAWPGWYWGPGLWWDGPGIGFGLSFRVGGGFHGFHGGFAHGHYYAGGYHARGFHGGYHGFHGASFHNSGIYGGSHRGGFYGGGFHGRR